MCTCLQVIQNLNYTLHIVHSVTPSRISWLLVPISIYLTLIYSSLEHRKIIGKKSALSLMRLLVFHVYCPHELKRRSIQIISKCQIPTWIISWSITSCLAYMSEPCDRLVTCPGFSLPLTQTLHNTAQGEQITEGRIDGKKYREGSLKVNYIQSQSLVLLTNNRSWNCFTWNKTKQTKHSYRKTFTEWMLQQREHRKFKCQTGETQGNDGVQVFSFIYLL